MVATPYATIGLMLAGSKTKFSTFLPFPSVLAENEQKIDSQTAAIALQLINDGTIPPKAWSRLGTWLDEIKRIAEPTDGI